MENFDVIFIVFAVAHITSKLYLIITWYWQLVKVKKQSKDIFYTVVGSHVQTYQPLRSLYLFLIRLGEFQSGR